MASREWLSVKILFCCCTILTVDLLCNLLYDKSTTKRSNGVWASSQANTVRDSPFADRPPLALLTTLCSPLDLSPTVYITQMAFVWSNKLS